MGLTPDSEICWLCDLEEFFLTILSPCFLIYKMGIMSPRLLTFLQSYCNKLTAKITCQALKSASHMVGA